MESESKKFIVQFQNEYYDFSKFVPKHPGGVNTLKGLEGADMSMRFFKAPPHSSAAMYLMTEYKVKEPLSSVPKCKASTRSNGYTKATNGFDNNFNEFYNQAIDDKIRDCTNNNVRTLTDDSMEHIVDWSKAMLPQIHKIAEHYNEWVNKPVDRPLRLFGPSYLEACTKTPWWVIPLFWIPVIVRLVYLELFVEKPMHLKASVSALYFTSGIIIWTFLEYSLHRWVFHMKTTRKNPWLCTFHFMMHGLHHKVPFDPYRLVFPPVPAAILSSIFYILLYFLSAYPKTTLAGGLLGYVCYDLTHYYLHYGDPSLWHMYQMKRYHYQHHFVHHDLGFGISSPVWDFVFGTRIYLRKLKYLLKWKY